MKIIAFIAAVILLYGCNGQQQKSNTDTSQHSETTSASDDKQRIKDYFDETYQDIIQTTQGLTEEQLNFKASPEKWSVLECVEHIVITEPMLFAGVKEAMENPATPEKRSEIKLSDDEIPAMLTNRDYKATAPAEMTPVGKYKDVASALSDLEEQRNMIFANLENYSIDDMRSRVIEAPFGSIDAYQFMLFIPGHAARHTLQMEEVKADSNFPSK
ncbi:DinB family protein [Sphingobacterium gobiense]|uniref:DinB family protein n=1 Tax=Sphingobacterium gobiense TaxID=1382456 RepID=A0A2S9JU88_9SPHI|nr:DinB family protein [Sphingobacterium gobiense]PRD56852.1 DinB family protein [Sphingobacterium gobiense]